MRHIKFAVMGFLIGAVLFTSVPTLADTVKVLINKMNITVGGEDKELTLLTYDDELYVPLASILDIFNKLDSDEIEEAGGQKTDLTANKVQVLSNILKEGLTNLKNDDIFWISNESFDEMEILGLQDLVEDIYIIYTRFEALWREDGTEETKDPKETSTQTETTFNLGAGRYVVGEDIPSGKYDLIAISGSGFISSDKLYLFQALGVKGSLSSFAQEYNNIRLSNGDDFEIIGNLKVQFTPK